MKSIFNITFTTQILLIWFWTVLWMTIMNLISDKINDFQ